MGGSCGQVWTTFVGCSPPQILPTARDHGGIEDGLLRWHAEVCLQGYFKVTTRTCILHYPTSHLRGRVLNAIPAPFPDVVCCSWPALKRTELYSKYQLPYITRWKARCTRFLLFSFLQSFYNPGLWIIPMRAPVWARGWEPSELPLFPVGTIWFILYFNSLIIGSTVVCCQGISLTRILISNVRVGDDISGEMLHKNSRSLHSYWQLLNGLLNCSYKKIGILGQSANASHVIQVYVSCARAFSKAGLRNDLPDSFPFSFSIPSCNAHRCCLDNSIFSMLRLWYVQLASGSQYPGSELL